MAVLYQLKLDQSIVDCGMSYVFQLNSGHFFIIDGGYFTPGEADTLYRFLCKRSEGKPEIDAWFFSHAHQDHVGVFLDMMSEHQNDIILHKLIYNFQPLDLPPTSEGWRETRKDLETVKYFYEVVEQKCQGIPVFTPHTGDCFRLDELSVEVLYTHEDLDVESTFNDHSTVLRVETNGWSILFLGDVFKEGCRIMLEKCPNKLPCDLVQVSHHGFAGATPELYQAANATIALWPATEEGIQNNLFREANDYLLNKSGIKHHLISSDGNMKLSFAAKTSDDDVAPCIEIVD